MSTRIATGWVILGLVCVATSASCAESSASPGSNAGSGGGGGRAAGSGAVGSAGQSGGGGGLGVSGRGARAGAGGTTSNPGNMAQVCPSAEPATGEACVSGRGDCTFGTRTCDCDGDLDTWVCWDPATDCPATKPAEQAACPVIGIACDYPQAAGQGGNDGCDCTDVGWDCGTQFCPPTEPAAAGACNGADGVCTYGSRICDCDSSIWVCWNPTTDCSTTPPTEDSVCPLEGVICDYTGGDCECSNLTWECDLTEDDGGV